jgi:hypothetical protein
MGENLAGAAAPEARGETLPELQKNPEELEWVSLNTRSFTSIRTRS